MGTPPSARGGWSNPGGERRSNRGSKGTRACIHDISAPTNESGQVPDEKVVELAFVV